MYAYLLILTMFLNCYIILVDTTLNDGTKSGTEVSSFNIYLVCVSFFMLVDKLDLKLCYVSRGTLIHQQFFIYF